MKTNILKFCSIIFLFIVMPKAYSQSYNDEKTSMANYLKRMYNNTPFEGVKVLESAEGNFFISVISLEKAKYTSQSTMNRVAQVKAQSQANTFFNGSTVVKDYIVTTNETKSSDGKKSTTVEEIEKIKENSSGFVNSLELLNNFEIEDGKRMMFIFYKEIK